MRIPKRLGQLGDPRLHIRRVQCLFPLQHVVQRLAIKLIHRNRDVIAILHKVIDAENVRVDELAVPFHLLAEFRHRTGIGSHCRGDKVKRHVFPEDFIARNPHRPRTGLAQTAAEHIAAANFRPLAQRRFGASSLGVQVVWR